MDDETVQRFVSLLRQQARLARFVNFLIVLCQCGGKAVRPNQWRVCRLLCERSPELLLNLSLRGGRVMVSGDPRYFPMFAEVHYILHYIAHHKVHHIVHHVVHYIAHYRAHYLAHYLVHYIVHFLAHSIAHCIVHCIVHCIAHYIVHYIVHCLLG